MAQTSPLTTVRLIERAGVVTGSFPWWLRAYLFFAAFQGFALGLTGLFSPGEIQIPVAMTALNARFVGSLYLAGGVGVAIAVFGRRRDEARIFALSFTLAIVIITCQILLRWNDYLADGLPHREGFFGAYIIDVLASAYVIPAAGFLAVPRRVVHSTTALFRVEAIVLAALGVALVVFPFAIASVWPWALPPVLSQLYGAFFLSLGFAAYLAASEPNVVAIRNFTITSLSLGVFILIVSVVHLARFKSGLPTWIWFFGFGIGVIIFAVAYLRQLSSKNPSSWRSSTEGPVETV